MEGNSAKVQERVQYRNEPSRHCRTIFPQLFDETDPSQVRSYQAQRQKNILQGRRPPGQRVHLRAPSQNKIILPIHNLNDWQDRIYLQTIKTQIKLHGNHPAAKAWLPGDPEIICVVKSRLITERLHKWVCMPHRVRFKIFQPLETILMRGPVTANQHLDLNHTKLPEMVFIKRQADPFQVSHLRLPPYHRLLVRPQPHIP